MTSPLFCGYARCGLSPSEARKLLPNIGLARLEDDPHPEIVVFVRSALLVGLLSLFHPLPEKILLDGSAQPCADSREATSGVPGVHVYAFNATKIPAIRNSLYVLDTLEWESGDPVAMRAAAREYDRLLAQVRK